MKDRMTNTEEQDRKNKGTRWQTSIRILLKVSKVVLLNLWMFVVYNELNEGKWEQLLKFRMMLTFLYSWYQGVGHCESIER